MDDLCKQKIWFFEESTGLRWMDTQQRTRTIAQGDRFYFNMKNKSVAKQRGWNEFSKEDDSLTFFVFSHFENLSVDVVVE